MRQTLLKQIQNSKVQGNLPIIYHLSFIISYLSFLISYLIVSAAPAVAQIQMRSVFAAMPDSVLPMVTKNNRLDCIDFIENNMEARVRNKVDEYVVLEALTGDYARFRTSAVAVMELKLLPTSDSTSVLCVVTTAESGEKGTERCVMDSNIRFYDTDWKPLSLESATASVMQQRDGDAFFAEAAPDSLQTAADAAKRSLASFHPVLMTLVPEDFTLTLHLQTGYLSIEERRALQYCLRPVTLRWNGQSFVAE